MAKQEQSYFSNLADIKKNNLKLFPGTHQTMIGSEKSTKHRQRNEKICRTHRESIRSEYIEKFSNKGKIRSLGYKFNTRKLSNSSLFMELRERCTV